MFLILVIIYKENIQTNNKIIEKYKKTKTNKKYARNIEKVIICNENFSVFFSLRLLD